MIADLTTRYALALRILFWLALIFAVLMALLPHPPALPLEPGDKVMHMLAFFCLTSLATAGFRHVTVWRLVERLSFVGALIEVFQSIPSLHRDCDPRDWLADTFAVVVAMLLVAALAGRWSEVVPATVPNEAPIL